MVLVDLKLWRKWRFSIFIFSLALINFFPYLAFGEWTEVTSSFNVVRTRPMYDFVAHDTYCDVSLTNISNKTYHAPIRLVINITNSQVTVRNADGITDDGKPYFNYGSLFGADNKAEPNETSSPRQIRFYNPNRLRFDFTTEVRIEVAAPTNQKPVANAGQNQIISLQSGQTSALVQLDGSGSYDLDGHIVKYSWTGNPDPQDIANPTLSLSPGTYIFILVVTDDKGAESEPSTVTITVLSPINNPPILIVPGPQSVAERGSLSFTVSSSDPDNDPLTISTSNIPRGAFFNSNTGIFNWVPDYDQAGNYTVIFSVSDGKIVVEKSVNITVVDTNRAPTIKTVQIPEGRVDQKYQAPIEAIDPDGDLLSFELLYQPEGMSINPVSGVLSWKPNHSQIGEWGVGVRVSDGKGGSDTRDYKLTVPDTIPPSIFLNAPKTAIPGASFTAVAEARDNIGISEVIISIEGQSPVVFGKPPYQQQVTLSPTLAIGSAVKIKAEAIDLAGNTGKTTAKVKIVSIPDTEPPAAKLNAPETTSPGSTLLISAQVSDDSGVSQLTFFINGEPIGTSTPLNPIIEYKIPEDIPPGVPLEISIKAEDFSGNVSEVKFTSQITETPDTTPPSASIVMPEKVSEGEPIRIALQIKDDTGVSKIEIFVDHTLVATLPQMPEDGWVEIKFPEHLSAGMEALVEVVVTDSAGNQTQQTQSFNIKEPGKGILRGEIYNDRTGLPLKGAIITFIHSDGTIVQETSNDKGGYSIQVKSGSGKIKAEYEGFTVVNRTGFDIIENRATEIIDIRLTPLSPKKEISSVSGGDITIPFDLFIAGYIPVLKGKGVDPATIPKKNILLQIPGGALQENKSISLNQVSPQGLEGLLPAGWSPLATIDIYPRRVGFITEANLTIPNLLGVGESDKVILAFYNEEKDIWVKLRDVSINNNTISASIPSTGQYAFLLPDLTPKRPPEPLIGEEIRGVPLDTLPEKVTTKLIPDPKILFYKPGVKSEVGLIITPENTPLSSGVRVQTVISEEYNFYSGAKINLNPFNEDIILYSFNRFPLTAAYPVTPSLEFEPMTLQKGIITVDIISPSARGLNMIGPEGGTIRLPTGEELIIPKTALLKFIPVELNFFKAEDLRLTLPDGVEFIKGLNIDLAGYNPVLPLHLSIPLPSGISSGQILLLRMVEVLGATRFVLSGLGAIEGNRIVTIYEINDGKNLRFPGILDEGRYLIVRTTKDIGFSTGRVFGVAGDPLPQALLLADTTSIVSLSRRDGDYTSLLPLGLFTLSAVNPVTLDKGSRGGGISNPGEIITLDISLREEPPAVIAIEPANNAVNVPLAASIKVKFSEPIDPSTLSTNNLILSGPQGIVAGSVERRAGNLEAVFRPIDPLDPNTEYTFTVTTGIKDLAGYSLPAPYTIKFKSLDTIPPPPPPTGNITATIPDADGKTIVSATQGSAGVHDTVTVINKTKNISMPALVNPDGSFSTTIRAGLTDKLVISIKDRAGNETTVSIDRFRNPDGSTVIGPEGGKLEAENGVILDIPPNAFPRVAIVRIKPLFEGDIPVSPGPQFPFVAGFEITMSEKPTRYLNVSAPLPQNAKPNAQGVVAKVVDVWRGKGLAVVDTAKAINGRLTTSSPPCPGITEKFGRYAMFLNEHEQMALGAAILSMGALPIKPLTYEVRWTVFPALPTPGGISVPLMFPYIVESGQTPYYPAEYFISRIGEIGVLGALAEAEMGRGGSCLPIPYDTPLKVVFRDSETGDIVNDIDIESPPPGQSIDITDLFIDPADKEPPYIIWTSWSKEGQQVLDVGEYPFVMFSEPIRLTKPDSIYLVDELDRKINGKTQLSNNNRIAIFVPEIPLKLSTKYTMRIEGVKDLGGNELKEPSEPLSFDTFSPFIINRYGRNDISFHLGRDIQDFQLKDLEFDTRTPSETSDGEWKTTLYATKAGLDGYFDQLFLIDVSDPLYPRGISSGYYAGRGDTYHGNIQFLRGYSHPVRESFTGSPYWMNRTLHYVVNNPSERICETDRNTFEVDAWKKAHCPDWNACATQPGCLNLVVTTDYSTKYSYLRAIDVADPDNPRWVGFRLLNDNGISYGMARRPEAPSGLGFARGFDLVEGMDISHKDSLGTYLSSNTVGAYVAVERIGLELVDLGLNIPGINESEVIGNYAAYSRRLSNEIVESLGLNSSPFYQDATVLRGKVITIAGDIGKGTNLRTLEIFAPDLSGEPTHIMPLPHIPEKITCLKDYLSYDANEDGTPEGHDFCFTSGYDGGISIIEIPKDGTPPQLRGFIPGGRWARKIEVDSEKKVLYVSAGWNDSSGNPVSGLWVVDASLPALIMGSKDEDRDGWDDRIIHRVQVTQTINIPEGHLNSIRYDKKRGLIYGAIRRGDNYNGEYGLVVIKACNCPEKTALIINEEGKPQTGSFDIGLNSGGVRDPTGEIRFKSKDNRFTSAFINKESQELCLYIDNHITPGLRLRYRLEEIPFSQNPDDKILDLTQNTGFFDSTTQRICVPIKILPEKLPQGSYLLFDLMDARGHIFKRLSLHLVPALIQAKNLRVKTEVDRINGDIYSEPEYLEFDLTYDGLVTVKIEGEIITQQINGTTIKIENVALPAGRNRFLITNEMLKKFGENELTIEVIFNKDPEISTTHKGKIVHDLVIKEALPLGHIFIKGVDLAYGHLTIQRQDFSYKGMGPPLEFIRTYSSSGSDSSGPMGAGWSHNYQSMVYVRGDGKVILIDGQGTGRKYLDPSIETDPSGKKIVKFKSQKGCHGDLIYDPEKDSYDFYTKARVKYHYEKLDNKTLEQVYWLKYIEEPHGNGLNLIYEKTPPFKLLEVREYPSGRSIRFRYIKKGIIPEDRIESIQGPLDLSIQYEYDNYGNLISAQRGEKKEIYQYTIGEAQDRHNLTKIIDPNGNETRFELGAWQGYPSGTSTNDRIQIFTKEYELIKAIEQGTGAEKSRWEISYDLSNRQITVKDGRGIDTQYTFNPMGNIVKVDVDGYVTQYTWDEDNLVMTSTTDPNGRITKWTYDERGNKISEEVAGAKAIYTYDPLFNKVTSFIDPGGRRREFLVDSKSGDVLEIKEYPEENKPIVKSFTYYPNGLPKTYTDPNGNVIKYEEYDAYGNPTRTKGPGDYELWASFDERGRILELQDSMGRHEKFEYDDLDRLIVHKKFSGSERSKDHIVTYAYYPLGQIKKIANGPDHEKEFILDSLNRTKKIVEKVFDAEGSTLNYEEHFTYDGNDNKIHYRDRRGINHYYAYNALNWVIEERVETRPTFIYTYDRAGNRLSEKDLYGDTIEFRYDGLYRLVEKILPTGHTIKYEYDLSGNKVSETDANGNKTTFAYDGANRLVKISNPLGHTTEFKYDQNGNTLEERHQPSGLIVKYEGYDGLNRPGRKIYSFLDKEYKIEFAYDDTNRSITITDPVGIKTVEKYDCLHQMIEKALNPTGLNYIARYSFDIRGNRDSVTDPRGNTTRFIFDGLNRLVKKVFPSGYEEKYFYDGEGNLVKHIDRNGNEFRSDYDHFNRKLKDILVERISNNGQELILNSFLYDDENHTKTQCDARGKCTVTKFDALHREIEVRDPLGNTFAKKWDGINTIEMRDKLGFLHKFSYDGMNRITRSEVYDGGQLKRTILYAYDDPQLEISETDGKGIVTKKKFDPLKRLIEVQKDGISLWKYEYDPRGFITKLIDANGNITLQEFDPAGRKTKVTHPDGSITTFHYDAANNLIRVKDGRNTGKDFDFQYTYDELNRKIKVEDASGAITTFTYDALDNVISFTDQNGNITRYGYDELGRIIYVDETQRVGGITRYAYDEQRNLVAQQDPDGHLTTFVYDDLNRRTDIYQHNVLGTLSTIRITNPLSIGDPSTALHWQYGYDSAGNLTRVVDPMGQVTEKRYDFAGNLLQIDFSNHQGKYYPDVLRLSFTYDGNNNLIRAEEKKIKASATTFIESYTMDYDSMDRLIRFNTPYGKSLLYEYDKVGNKTSLTYPNGKKLTYSYNPMNELIEVNIPGLGPIKFIYLPDRLMEKIIYPNGVVTSFEYEPTDRVKRIVTSKGTEILAEYIYSYDPVGNQLAQTETHRALGILQANTRYNYDGLNRLNGYICPGGTNRMTYTYSLNGNRLEEKGSDCQGRLVDKAFTFNNYNQLIELRDNLDPSASIQYFYDPNGNLINRKTGHKEETFGYNIRDQLNFYSDGTSSFSYDYDYDGRRVKKETGNEKTGYLYDETALVEEYDSESLAPLLTYYYGEDLLARENASGSIALYHLNGIDSVGEITDSSGSILSSYQYDPWGNILTSQEGIENHRNFLSHFLDKESNLTYFGARYYDPATSRFITQDPFLGKLENPISLHRYLYAHANPFYYVDLYGYEAIEKEEGFWRKAFKGFVEGTGIPETLRQSGDMLWSGLIILAAHSPAANLYGGKRAVLEFGEAQLKSQIAQAAKEGATTEDLLWGMVKSLNPIDTLKNIGTALGEGAAELYFHGDPERLASALTQASLIVPGYRKPATEIVANAGKKIQQVGTTINILSRKRASKRYFVEALEKGIEFMPEEVQIKKVGRTTFEIENPVPVYGSITPKDAWIMAGLFFERGAQGGAIVGGFTKPSFKNLIYNLKEWAKGNKGLGRGDLVVKEGALKFQGDVDLIVFRKDKPYMTDWQKAAHLNANMDARNFDTTVSHGILGRYMPEERVPKWVREKFEGKPIDAYTYQKYGIPTLYGRKAPIIKSGSNKVNYRDPDPAAFKVKNWWDYPEYTFKETYIKPLPYNIIYAVTKPTYSNVERIEW